MTSIKKRDFKSLKFQRFLKTSPKIGDKAVLMAVLWLGVFSQPL
ncbi:hypothetical protein [Helicobacter pylori]|nr:hypothetical protein [Helicobacter pylori]